jgi:ArsR family transcriptional regulator, virulence genes transcriptional regulator
MNLVELQSKAGAVEALLKAVGNRNRLIVLCELKKGERSVGAVQQALGLSQSGRHDPTAVTDDLLFARQR